MEFNNILDITSYLNGIVDSGSAKAQDIPSPLILIGAENKKGLSAREMAKEVIIRSQEAGIPIGNLPSGEESISEKMEFIRMQVIVKHLIENAKITVVVPPGTPVATTGTSPVGPVVTQGATTSLAIGKGILQ